MNITPDDKWHSLLARSAPAFAAETTLPYGLTTRTLALLRAEEQNRVVSERIGLRAILAALAALGVAALITISVHTDQDQLDEFDSGVKSVVTVHSAHLS